MLEVTLSEKNQIVIPQEVSDHLQLKIGQKFTMKSFRGILKGANTENIRDHNDRI